MHDGPRRNKYAGGGAEGEGNRERGELEIRAVLRVRLIGLSTHPHAYLRDFEPIIALLATAREPECDCDGNSPLRGLCEPY